eukprot:2853641-Prymnesium_polylepis.1
MGVLIPYYGRADPLLWACLPLIWACRPPNMGRARPPAPAARLPFLSSCPCAGRAGCPLCRHHRRPRGTRRARLEEGGG